MRPPVSMETRKKMSEAKKRNPVKFWLGKGDLLRKAVQDLTSALPRYIHDEILERDQYQCVKCGSTKKLHVHHIDKRDGRINTIDPPNHGPENLITLCAKCHEAIHRNSDLARKAQWPISRSSTIVCEYCGKVFKVSQWEINEGRKYCSRTCCGKAKIGKPLPRKPK